MRRFTAGTDDIVVIVPRWIIIVVGLVMLLGSLSFSFLFILSGFVEEGAFFALASAVIVPLNLLLLYIFWRFYWYFLALSLLASSLCSVTLITGLVRVSGMYVSPIRSGGVPIFQSSNLTNIVIGAFALAFLVVALLAALIFTFIMPPRPRPMNYDVESLDRPVRRKKGRRDLWEDEKLPHPHDPYWDDK